MCFTETGMCYSLYFKCRQLFKMAAFFCLMNTTNNKETLEQIVHIISEFLKQRGLELSKEKTTITHISNGFDFLGWNFKKYNGKLIIKASVKSLNKVTKKASEIIHKNRTAKQEYLIYKLNQVLRGWCNYHQTVCSKQIFKVLNHRIFTMLWKWAEIKKQ